MLIMEFSGYPEGSRCRLYETVRVCHLLVQFHISRLGRGSSPAWHAGSLAGIAPTNRSASLPPAYEPIACNERAYPPLAGESARESGTIPERYSRLHVHALRSLPGPMPAGMSGTTGGFKILATTTGQRT